MTASPMDPGHDCARAWELMPAALLGHADEERGRWLASHLGRCEACSAEFAQQQRLRRALSLPTDLPLDPQAGLRRLLERIDAPPAQAAPARSRGWAIKALAASVLIQAVGLGVLSSQLYAANQRAGYRTLSDAPPRRRRRPRRSGSCRIRPCRWANGTRCCAGWNCRWSKVPTP